MSLIAAVLVNLGQNMVLWFATLWVYQLVCSDWRIAPTHRWMEQIGQAMTNIQQATVQALTSTRQAERAAQDLHNLAQSLQQTIAVYRL